MGYITARDYLKTIQDVNLLQIITSNRSIQKLAEQSAQAEAISFLKQKYDVTKEFTDTTKWAQSEPYSAADRVYLDADAYSAGATSYALGALVVYQYNVYRCIVAIAAPETFTIAKWELLGEQGAIFYALFPFDEFDIYKQYVVGNKVFHKGNQYTCLIGSTTLSHELAIQYNQQNSLPLGNVFPDDLVNGAQYWQNDGAYIVPADSDILNEALWTLGDNRDAQMVEKIVDITLYHLHSRISPTNIPLLRKYRYMGNDEDKFNREGGGIAFPIYSALGWLQGCARGEITPNLPKIQPKQGGRIRFGGQIRNINSY